MSSSPRSCLVVVLAVLAGPPLVLASLVASPPTARAAKAPDVVERQAQIRAVLDGFGLAPGDDEISLGPRGRRDLVVFSPRARDAVILALKTSYREGRTLPHGFRVGGWANIIAADLYTFTLKDESEGSWVIELADAPGGGCRILIRGLGRTLLPERRPRAELPLRLVAPEP